MIDPSPVEELPDKDESGPDAGEGDTIARGRVIRRILVALDASSNSRAAMAAAIGLAETLKTEVHGLFVEDINLLRLAELPFAREVLFAETGLRQLERDSLVRKLHARAAILRREIEELATEHQIVSSFQVRRGSVNKELLSEALDSDLLVIGRMGQSISRRIRLGSTARAIVDQSRSAVLLVKSDVGIGPIIALYDGSAVGRRVLELASELSSHSGDLRVLVWAATEAEAFESRQLAVRILGHSTTKTQFQHLSGDNPQLVLEWVNRQKGSLLLIGGGATTVPTDIFQTLLDEAEQHILVIR